MKIICNGCSLTYGDGFLDHEREILSYPGLLAKRLPAEVTNIAYPGSSNLEIFLRTVRETQHKHFDLVIVQWTQLRRYWFEPCLGYIYQTAREVKSDWMHGCYISKKKQIEFNDQLIMLSSDYKSLLDLACFCQSLMDRLGDKVVFVDGLVNLSSDLFFSVGNDDMRSYFGNFAKQVLEFDDKPDSDIKEYHHRLVDLLDPTLDHWVNLGNSWKKNISDTATLGHHPGPKSHKWLSDIIISHIA